MDRTLDIAAANDDIEVLGLCTADPRRLTSGTGRWRTRLRRQLARLITPSRSIPVPSVKRLIKRHRLRLVVPPNRDPNDPAFIRWLAEDLRPNVALSLYSLCVFKKPLLNAFEQAVNFHDALLPKYRGLMATSWSIYHGETQSGLTFHRMNENLDDGNILIQCSVPVAGDVSLASVTRAKQVRAVQCVPQLINKLRQRDPGRAQTGPASYFSQADLDRMIRPEAPGALDLDELTRRLRAFGVIRVQQNGRWHRVEDWVVSAHPGNPFDFVTRDGQHVVPTRIEGLPPWLYRLTMLRLPARRRGGR